MAAWASSWQLPSTILLCSVPKGFGVPPNVNAGGSISFQRVVSSAPISHFHFPFAERALAIFPEECKVKGHAMAGIYVGLEMTANVMMKVWSPTIPTPHWHYGHFFEEMQKWLNRKWLNTQ